MMKNRQTYFKYLVPQDFEIMFDHFHHYARKHEIIWTAFFS